jgi:glutathione synthase/RimK-type ligase-like ATP-grasp enzyme
MIYELRIYTLLPQRLDAINDRFSTYTLNIFQRLDMKVVDFWESLEDQPKLYYTMEFASMEDRNVKWKQFTQDPEWIDVRSRSEVSGPIVEKVESIFLKRSDYFYQGRT